MLKVEISSQYGGNSSIEQSIIRKSTINEQRDSLDWPSNRLNHSGNRWTHIVCDICLYCCCCEVPKARLTLCDPVGCSPPGFSVHGITQTRILEWVAISFSRGFSGPREWTQRPRDWIQVSCIADRFFTVWATKETLLVIKVNPRSHVRLFATPWTKGYQAPLSMGFSRQEY